MIYALGLRPTNYLVASLKKKNGGMRSDKIGEGTSREERAGGRPLICLLMSHDEEQEAPTIETKHFPIHPNHKVPPSKQAMATTICQIYIC